MVTYLLCKRRTGDDGSFRFDFRFGKRTRRCDRPILINYDNSVEGTNFAANLIKISRFYR